jgi:hypothetical protein
MIPIRLAGERLLAHVLRYPPRSNLKLAEVAFGYPIFRVLAR